MRPAIRGVGPTARGVAVLAVLAGIAYTAVVHGARSFGVVFVALVVVALASVASVVTVDRPVVERRPIAPGCAGDGRRVDLTVRTGRPTLATVRDRVGPGLTAPDAAGDDGPTIETTVDADATVAYDLELDARGERTVGPATVDVRDPFGLLERRFRDDRERSVLVYPPVHSLGDRGQDALSSLVSAARGHDRGEFDHLREYRPGDSLRDVDWKATARRVDGDPVVAEYAADGSPERVSIVAAADPGGADALATAAASVCVTLLDHGVGVALHLPDETVTADPGAQGVTRVLTALATVDAGPVATPPQSASVRVRATREETAVVVDGREHRYADLRGPRRRLSTFLDAGPAGGGGQDGASAHDRRLGDALESTTHERARDGSGVVS